MDLKSLEHNRQFLFTKHKTDSWKNSLHVTVGDYNLYYHPNLHYSYSKKNGIELFLLGDLYDYSSPSFSNLNILDKLTECNSFHELLENTDRYCGDFILIYKTPYELKLFNDACAQKEVYYTSDFNHFASQPKLVQKVCTLEQIEDKEAQVFFKSAWFKKRKYFVGNKTHLKKLFHLTPNHFIDITEQKINRFYPLKPLIEHSVEQVANQAKKMLKGYLKAISNRFPVALPITAGYDSRLLFALSIHIPCTYFVYKRWKINGKHPDIFIPEKLVKILNKELKILKYDNDFNEEIKNIFETSIDYYHRRFALQAIKGDKEYFQQHVIINGNIGEISRNYYGNFRRVSAGILSYFQNSVKYSYTKKAYQEWLQEGKEIITKNGYNIYDLFYWEEKMGNWGAKRKTEFSMGSEIVSPYNSRELLNTMLSCNRKYRDYHHNILYNTILNSVSPQLINVPVNPGFKRTRIVIAKKIHAYSAYKLLIIMFKVYFWYPVINFIKNIPCR